MTFEELNEQVVAIRVKNFLFDYFGRVFKLEAHPQYGYKEELKDKMFQIEIGDCIYFCSSNTSKMAGGLGTEFIVWGKHPEEECKEAYCNKLIENFLSKTPSGADDKNSFVRRALDKQYCHYFFQNALGDAIDVLASKDSVREIGAE